MHVIIGSTHEALSQCVATGATVIYNNPRPPYPFEDLHEEWCTKVLNLNMAGKGIYYEKVKSIRIEDDTINLLLKNNKVEKISYDLCEIFDCTGLDLSNFEILDYKERYVVYDFFNIKSLDKTDVENIKSKEHAR